MVHNRHVRECHQICARCWDEIVDLYEGKDRDDHASVYADTGGGDRLTKT